MYIPSIYLINPTYLSNLLSNLLIHTLCLSNQSNLLSIQPIESTLSTTFHESSFEIDVTNPAATVKLEVRDFPKLPIPMNKGTYLGQLTLTLGHFADGWPVRKVYQLRGFDKITGMDKIEKFDRGEGMRVSLLW